MSPESLRYQKVSKESDAWSYGVLLWEIYSYGCTPYPLLQPEDILEKLLSGYRMEKPKDCDDFIYENIVKSCWDIDPKNRPKFSQLVESFEGLLNSPDYVSVKVLVDKQKTECDQVDEADLFSFQQVKISNSSVSDSVTSLSDMRLGLNVPNCLTSSASSFNNSTNTTTTTSQSHSAYEHKDVSVREPLLEESQKFDENNCRDFIIKLEPNGDKKMFEDITQIEKALMTRNDLYNNMCNDNKDRMINSNFKNIFSLFRINSNRSSITKKRDEHLKNRVLISDV